MNAKTIHQSAIQYLHITFGYLRWQDNHPSCPQWIAEKIVRGMKRAAIKRAAREAITPAHTYPMTRKDVEARWEYRGEMAVIATGLRRETGLSGSTLRALAAALRNRRYAWGADLRTVDAVPDSAIDGVVGEIRRSGVYREHVDGRQPHGWNATWSETFHPGLGVQALILMALTDAVRLDIGAHEAQQLLARLRAGSNISGYLADDVAGWMRGDTGHPGAYERCSGGEMYTWLRYHPEHWPLLLAHSPQGKSTDTAIQCYPHEHAKADACHRAGLFHTLRLNDSIYSGTPEQVASVLQEVCV